MIHISQVIPNDCFMYLYIALFPKSSTYENLFLIKFKNVSKTHPMEKMIVVLVKLCGTSLSAVSLLKNKTKDKKTKIG